MLKKSSILVLLVMIVCSVSVFAASGDKVAAIVNGQKITVKEVDQYANLNQKLVGISKVDKTIANLLFSTSSGQKVLNEYRKKEVQNMITKKLLVKEAAQKKVTLTEREKNNIFNNQVNSIKKKHKWSNQDLLNALKKKGFSSLAEYKKSFFNKYQNLIVIGKLKKLVLNNNSFKIADSEIKTYYNNNQDKFKKSGKLKPLKDVKDQIRKTLLQQKENKYWQNYIKQVVSKAKVDIKL